MPRASRLLPLYPRAWRDRYGDEFLAMLGDDPLQLQQIIDIVSGAVDAWLSADVRRATMPVTESNRGGPMLNALAVCERHQRRYTRRDGLIGGAIMIAVTLILSLAGAAMRRAGWADAGMALVSTSYLVAMTLSMPFWLLKGQPLRAQMVIVGVTSALTILVAWLA